MQYGFMTGLPATGLASSASSTHEIHVHSRERNADRSDEAPFMVTLPTTLASHTQRRGGNGRKRKRPDGPNDQPQVRDGCVSVRGMTCVYRLTRSGHNNLHYRHGGMLSTS
jgi:hypothetical protein